MKQKFFIFTALMMSGPVDSNTQNPVTQSSVNQVASARVESARVEQYLRMAQIAMGEVPYYTNAKSYTS